MTGEAGTRLFQATAELGFDVRQAGAFIFCEGPGSVLGIRTSAMAIRTWNALAPRPTFAFRSLEVVACSLGRPGIRVIADARRDTWHCLATAADGGLTSLQRIPTAELTGPLVTPEGFRHWSALPPHPLETVSYDLSAVLPRIAAAELFRLTDDPDAFLHEEPRYLAWTPRIHQAPAPS